MSTSICILARYCTYGIIFKSWSHKINKVIGRRIFRSLLSTWVLVNIIVGLSMNLRGPPPHPHQRAQKKYIQIFTLSMWTDHLFTNFNPFCVHTVMWIFLIISTLYSYRNYSSLVVNLSLFILLMTIFREFIFVATVSLVVNFIY